MKEKMRSMVFGWALAVADFGLWLASLFSVKDAPVVGFGNSGQGGETPPPRKGLAALPALPGPDCYNQPDKELAGRLESAATVAVCYAGPFDGHRLRVDSAPGVLLLKATGRTCAYQLYGREMGELVYRFWCVVGEPLKN